MSGILNARAKRDAAFREATGEEVWVRVMELTAEVATLKRFVDRDISDVGPEDSPETAARLRTAIELVAAARRILGDDAEVRS